jgi:tetratricopeptide (TPR) repeat protein
VRVTAKLGELTWNQEGDIERAVVDMTRSFEVLANEEPSPELAMLAVQLARVLFFSGHAGEAMARNELALEIAEALELPEVLSHALNTKSVLLVGLGRRQEARLLLGHALDVALANDLSEAAMRAYNNLAGGAATSDRAREALGHLRAMSELAQRVGDRVSRARADASTFRQLITLGEWSEALELMDELLRTDAADDSSTARLELSLELIYPLLQRGELEGARRRFEEWAEVADQRDVQVRAAHGLWEALLLLAEGKPAEATGPAEKVLASSLGVGHWTTTAGIEVGLEVAAALHDGEKVDELLSLIESTPPGHVSPYLRALGARFGAYRAAREGDLATASAGFGAAADLLRGIERPFDLAVVLLEHAEWLVADGLIEESAATADEAREIFERLQAKPWLERLDRIAKRVPQVVVD